MEKSLIDAVAQLIRDLGFPIVVACWFMFRTDKRIEKMAKTLNEISGKLNAAEDVEEDGND